MKATVSGVNRPTTNIANLAVGRGLRYKASDNCVVRLYDKFYLKIFSTGDCKVLSEGDAEFFAELGRSEAYPLPSGTTITITL